MNHLRALIFFLLFSIFAYGQKVGLVLSGGGASGLAHIGVLKALEENNIPIHYIGGTSIGAMIAGAYAMGYTVKQIDSIVKTPAFIRASQGVKDEKYLYYFNNYEFNSSWINLNFDPGSILTSLPTSLKNPHEMDFNIIEYYGRATSLNSNFDSLMIPFRSVSANITDRELVVFRKGNFPEAIKASFAYPFYLKPVTIDGKIYVDGGLYNNFPADVIEKEFNPDVIIGSNVSGATEPPTPDNLLSQVRNMMTTPTQFKINCESNVMIEPNVGYIDVFDFENPGIIVLEGYNAAQNKMAEIKNYIKHYQTKEELKTKRIKNYAKLKPFLVNKITFSNLNDNQKYFLEKIKPRLSKPLDLENLKKFYYRMYSEEFIDYVYPTIQYADSGYAVNFNVTPSKPFSVELGGNISNNPISMGFAELKYRYFSKIGLRLSANTYFGKLYTSVQTKARIDFPFYLPVYAEASFTLNRFDFFKSSNQFFQDVKPPYLIQREQFANFNFGNPIFRKGKLQFGANYGIVSFEYYQTRNFSQFDTSDFTEFRNANFYMEFERNSLNRKMYPSKGGRLLLKANYIKGEQFERPGNTSIENKLFRNIISWYSLKFRLDQYIKTINQIKFGISAEALYSNQPFFNNYTGTLLSLPSFEPTPESRTIFMENFRSNFYAAGAGKLIIEPVKNIEIRAELWYFQKYREIINNEFNKAEYKPATDFGTFTGLAALVFHSPVGPLALTVNYYQTERIPVTFMFHFGYIIFNRRCLN